MPSKPPHPQAFQDTPQPPSSANEDVIIRGWLVDARLKDSVQQLIRLRWLAGVGVFLAALAIGPWLKIANNTTQLAAVGVLIVGYNSLFFGLNNRYSKQNTETERYMHLAIGQMVLDWLAMILLIHFSGGIESPAIYFFLFHIVIASIFYKPRMAYTFAGFALFLVLVVTILEYFGILPHYAVAGYIRQPLYENPLFLIGVLAFFGFTAIFITYLVTRIAEDMRRSAAEARELSQSLQKATTRLEILNESARTVNSTLDISQVLDHLVKNTAEALGVKAATIRLVDVNHQTIKIAAVYGLSKTYQDRVPVDIHQSPLDRKVLEGTTVNIPDISETSLLLHPEMALMEGYASMLTAPLLARSYSQEDPTGEQGESSTLPLGTLRAYATERNHFTPEDEDFLTAIAAQGSIAIENALAYKAIESLEATKSTFVRTATHELRSPVGVTLSLLRNITDGYAGEINDQQRNLLMRAIRRAEFLQELIDDLLDLAAGKIEGRDFLRTSNLKNTPLVPILQQVVSRYEIPAQEKCLTLRLQTPENSTSILVQATPDGLDRIFNNLISNAIKYTPSGGQVVVSLTTNAEKIQVSINDTGIGIPADALPNLFTEFYRAANAKEIESKGTGLGLTIAHNTVESFGGEISVESQIGVGTLFIVSLPQSKQPAE